VQSLIAHTAIEEESRVCTGDRHCLNSRLKSNLELSAQIGGRALIWPVPEDWLSHRLEHKNEAVIEKSAGQICSRLQRKESNLIKQKHLQEPRRGTGLLVLRRQKPWTRAGPDGPIPRADGLPVPGTEANAAQSSTHGVGSVVVRSYESTKSRAEEQTHKHKNQQKRQ